MKTLLIMRHGHSPRPRDDRDDIERSLSQRGRDSAQLIGELLRAEELVPELVVCSTARRARQTAVVVADACGYAGDVDYRPELYGGTFYDYAAVLHGLPEETARVLVVGHNPAAEDLVGVLSGMEKSLPTAAVAHLRLPSDTWPGVSLHMTGALANLWRPRDVASAVLVH